MKTIKIVLALLILVLALPDAEAQRGKRSSSKRPSKNASKAPSDFSNKLWYGAGGTLGFPRFQDGTGVTVGLLPQVGYKFNNWLSAGPRLGATYTGIKGLTDRNERQRVNMWDFNASIFARARFLSFYLQPEIGIESRETFFTTSGFITTDVNNEPAKQRSNEDVFLIGLGYNPGVGNLSSDIALYYNILDDVDSNTPPITLRIMLTFGY